MDFVGPCCSGGSIKLPNLDTPPAELSGDGPAQSSASSSLPVFQGVWPTPNSCFPRVTLFVEPA